MEIRQLSNKWEDKWNDFVMQERDSTIYHLSMWKDVIRDTYGHKPYYLLAEENGEIKGILPLISVTSYLFGNKLISLPYLYCTGVCSSLNDTREELIKEAISIADRIESDNLELRSAYRDINAMANNTQFVTSILKLDPDPNITFACLPKGKRYDIRKSKQQNNFFAVWGDSTENFYGAYSKIMNDLGTPPHNIKFFANILEKFPNNSKIVSILKNGEHIGSHLVLTFKDIMIDNTGGCFKEFKSYYPNDFFHWTAIEHACKSGLKYYDLGRSTSGSSNHSFKLRYNSESRQLYYQYYLTNSEIPSYDLSKVKYRFFTKLWKSIPLNLTKLVGPSIRKYIP